MVRAPRALLLKSFAAELLALASNSFILTHGGFARANRSLEFSVRHALGEVRYRVDAATLLHEDFARAAVGRGQARYPGFSDDPLDGFRDLATDLVRFGSVFLAGTTAEFAALVTKAERTRPPRGFAALSPGHHPARLGLGAPQDATGAERCAVSVGPRRSNVRDSAR